MTNKQLKKLAKEIANLELIIQNPKSTTFEENQAKDKIEKISSSINTIDDLMTLDEYVMEILTNDR